LLLSPQFKSTCVYATAVGEQNKEDAAIAEAPFAKAVPASSDPLTAGDKKPSFACVGRSSATGVNCEQNETCSRAATFDLDGLKALPRPVLNVALLLDFVALDDDKVLLPAVMAVGALAMHGLEEGSGWSRRCALYAATNSGSMSHSGTQESLSSPSHLTWNSLKLQSPCRTILHEEHGHHIHIHINIYVFMYISRPHTSCLKTRNVHLSSIRDATTQYMSSAAAIVQSDTERLSLRLPWLVRLADMLDAGDCEAAFVPARGEH
jgi:hypothetical protein